MALHTAAHKVATLMFARSASRAKAKLQLCLLSKATACVVRVMQGFHLRCLLSQYPCCFLCCHLLSFCCHQCVALPQTRTAQTVCRQTISGGMLLHSKELSIARSSVSAYFAVFDKEKQPALMADMQYSKNRHNQFHFVMTADESTLKFTKTLIKVQISCFGCA